MPRNLIICCDGTGNQISTDPSNVMRLWSTLELDQTQIGFYDPGVGTLGDPRILTPLRKQLRKRLDGAIGYSIRDNFIEAYSFIARHYQDTDRLFLFGFSRGAYTARAIAGAIHLFGLTRPEHENLAPYVWRTYSNDDGDEDSKTLFETAARFHKRFTRKVPIHFVGVWDTVSSFGLVTHFRTLPHTRDNPSVAHVRHAVSIDEHRACFRANHSDPSVPGQTCKEVWFAGVHSDIGGGYPERHSGLAKIALRWMLREAHAAGLRISEDRYHEVLKDPGPDPSAEQHESLDGWWRLLEFLPQRRWNHAKRRLAWHLPSFFRRRPMCSRERPVPTVHESVRDRIGAGSYRPRNMTANVNWEPSGADPFPMASSAPATLPSPA
ncbi:hypothetical protein PHYC_03269 [Phycisphaerales bacterium]|nr:hypothetical protein PHYC_03269 [Phycisphaerales bacterium]